MSEIRVIVPDAYPVTMQNMHRPPDKLYMRGSFSSEPNLKYLCVIGSRLPSSYGKDACKKLISGLKGYPISIVSGLAIGIDSLSHEAALEAGLHCVGFPGSGLNWNRIYPISRQSLAMKIIKSGGVLLSESKPDDWAQKWTFPSRNVLMAGISHAVLVIEARRHSGSLITVKYGENFSRDILAVPGSIYSELSYGPHMLIKRGAVPITTSEDILEALGFDVKIRSKVASEKFNELDECSQKVMKLLTCGEMPVSELSETSGMTANELSIALSTLELEGYVKIQGAVVRLA